MTESSSTSVRTSVSKFNPGVSCELLTRVCTFPLLMSNSAIRLYLTDALPDHVFTELKRSRAARFVTLLREENVAFVPFESRVFLLDSPRAFCDVLSHRRHAKLERYAEQLASVCSNFHEAFEIRYQAEDENCVELARLLAPKVSAGMNNQSQVVIVDRGYDAAAPFLHELTYQAMIFDILEVNGDVATVGGKEVLLKEGEDAFWGEFRHAHLATCFSRLTDKFAALTAKKEAQVSAAREASQSASGSGPSTAQLAELMQMMPQFQREIASLQLHMTLVNLCDKYYDQWGNDICDVEQALATKNTAELGKKAALGMMIKWLKNSEVAPSDKMRVILLYVIQRGGIKEDEFDALIRHAGLDASQKAAIQSMANFNIPIGQGEPTFAKMPRKDYSDKIKFADSQYVPYVKDIMLVRSKLNAELQAANLRFTGASY